MDLFSVMLWFFSGFILGRYVWPSVKDTISAKERVNNSYPMYVVITQDGTKCLYDIQDMKFMGQGQTLEDLAISLKEKRINLGLVVETENNISSMFWFIDGKPVVIP